ncbi:MAG: restriction endonuclease subunit S [Verrucomicrobiota bacterium]
MKKGWHTRPFEDCIESVKYTRKIQRKDFLNDGQFPIVSQEAEFINGYWDDEADLFKVSTPVVIFGDHTQILKYVDFDFVLGADGVKILPPCDFLQTKFFFYQLQAANFTTLGYARHYRLLKELEIKYPPLAEQQRIVGLLDEAFEGLATAKANAEKNLQNARALFESHLQSIFTQRGPGWKSTTLGVEIDLLAGFAFKSAKYTNDNNDMRLLRGDNIVPGGLRWDDVKKWPADDVGDYERYKIQEGDVVLAMDRPWIKAGLKHATITSDDLPCLLVQRTARLRGGLNLDNRYLMLLIGSAAFTSHILGVQTGIGVPHISGQQIKDFEFARPPLADQRRIAKNLELLREETQRLARLYERKLAALEALKKSLLHQAFSGEL